MHEIFKFVRGKNIKKLRKENIHTRQYLHDLIIYLYPQNCRNFPRKKKIQDAVIRFSLSKIT